MKHTYRKFLFPLRRGTRLLLLLISALYLAAFIGAMTKTFDLIGWLGLHSPSIWHGEVWRVITYGFIPPNLLNLVLNGMMFALLGTYLERNWSGKELWFFCILCAAGAALAKILVMPNSPHLMVTSVSIVFGLLVAWAKLFGHERVELMAVWEMSVRTAALIFAAISILAMLPCAGILNTLIMLCGGLTGWLYLTLRSRALQSRASQTTGSVRMERLEL